MKIVIPSKGRPNSSTLKLLKDENIAENTAFCVVRKSEYDSYLPAVEGTNITLIQIEDDDRLDDATTRNAGMEYIVKMFPEERFIVFIDDDLLKVVSNINGYKSKTIFDASSYLIYLLQQTQKKYPSTWFMSARQPGPFMEPNIVSMNSGTPWVCMCAIDLSLRPENMFLSTKEFGPQEITVPLFSFYSGKWYATTTCVVIYVNDSLVGGISTIINTESREEREKMYYETLQKNFGRYTSLRTSRTLGMKVTRCNFNQLKKDFDFPKESFKVQI